jgi:hypothetical protein
LESALDERLVAMNMGAEVRVDAAPTDTSWGGQVVAAGAVVV